MKNSIIIAILILLFASISWGQGSNTIPLPTTAEQRLEAIPMGARTVLREVPITIQDLLDYERECYADSSAEYLYFYNGLGERKKFATDVRRKDPTFTGFIEWLKKRKQK